METMALGLLIAALWAPAAFPQSRREAPAWVAQRPRVPDCFVGIGVARIEGDLPAAREQAAQNALHDIALQVEARVSSDVRLRIDEEEEGMNQEYRAEIRTQVAEELAGVEIAGTYQDAEHCWVYARLSVEEFQRRRQERAAAARRLARQCLERAEGKAPAEALALYLRGFAALQLAPGEPLRAVYRGEEIALATEIPLRIQQLLSAIRLEAAPIAAPVEQGRSLGVPLEVRAWDAGERPVQGLPMRFSFIRGGGELVGVAVTGADGVARSRLQRVRAPERVQLIEVRLELPEFLEPDSRSGLERRLGGFALPAVVLPLEVAPQAIWFSGQESNLGSEIGYLAPLVRAHLERQGQGLVEDPGQADLVVELRARTRQGAQWQELCFAFADLSLTVRDRVSGAELFTMALNNVKGAGPNFEQAGIRALEQAGQQLEEQGLADLFEHLHR